MKNMFIAIGIGLVFSISIASQASAKPIACWDLNENHICDLGTEDTNNDGKCNPRDCHVVEEPCYGVPKTGQTSTMDFHGALITSDDGYLQKGIEWPVPRFTDNNDGTVTDHLTRLVWLKNANCFGLIDWYHALFSAEDLASGQCQLTDGSVVGDWRVPNRNELLSTIDIEVEAVGPKIAGQSYFTNFGESNPYYWTSSTAPPNWPAEAYYVNLYDGTSGYRGKREESANYCLVWPVRDAK